MSLSHEDLTEQSHNIFLIASYLKNICGFPFQFPEATAEPHVCHKLNYDNFLPSKKIGS